MIRTLLWDVDGTLLDFKAAERAAVRCLFSEFSLGECTDEMIRRYQRGILAKAGTERDYQAAGPDRTV